MADAIEDEHYINWNQFVLPHDYGDAEREYLAIRNSCAMFDVSPIRKIHVTGIGAGNFFDRLLTRPVSNLPAMRATYTVFCNEDGSLKDDAILYKYADDDYLLMPSDVDHSPYFESVCRRFGLSALQACRLEGGFIVAGWDFATELDPKPGFERSPYELGLGWLVNLDAADFVGRNALAEQKKNGHRFTLRSFEINSNSPPDDGEELYISVDDDTLVGSVNCSGWSWGMNKTIGNASIKSEHAALGHAWIELGGQRLQVRLSRGPLITLERRNKVPASL